jgi:hypothetical protein
MMTSKRSQSLSSPSLLRRGARTGLASLALAGTIVGTGCLDRPIQDSKPVTTNVVVQKQANNAITGIDLLLMIDNSSSMADKQKVLAAAVPQLLSQLVQPQCLDASGNPVGAVAQLGVGCTTGSPEFNPVNNIHVGIVTSSLGDHGYGTITKGLCYPGAPTQYPPNIQPPDVNDMGHLVGTLARFARTGADSTYATFNAAGFLAWGDPSLPSPGDTDLQSGSTLFQDMVSSTQENGCGFEAQLEGWFRFLIDPVPPTYPLANPDSNSQTHRTGSDDTVLNQRAVFLRPDSLVAIVMLTDENDCSIRDTDVGWVSDDTIDSIPTGSAPCKTNPNDKCCYSCTAGAPSGCAWSCPVPQGQTQPAAVDDGTYQANIRCWQQKRRFGYEFLYPKSRYVIGLTNPQLCPDQDYGDMDCSCTYANSIGASCHPGSRTMPNPLYSTTVGYLNNGQPIAGYPKSIPRSDNSAIFLAGIVGVPWQDIGYTDANGNLVYIPVTDPAWSGGTTATPPVNAGTKGIWDRIYGDDNANITPSDVHMQESVVPRQGVPVPTPGPTAPTNTDPNGADYNTAREDLEYACIFQLPTPRPCACTPGTDFASCKFLNPNDCCDTHYDAAGDGTAGADYDKPLCDPATNTQVYAKGYPGLREIAVLHDYALQGGTQGNSIVASICPNDLKSANTSPGYGYNPAVAALINRLKEKLKGSCLPRPLTSTTDAQGNVVLPCNVVEVVSATTLNKVDCLTYCKNNLRDVASASTNPDGSPNPQMTAAVLDSMKQSKLCDGAGQPACSSMCMCTLPQEQGADLTTCQNATDGSEDKLAPGYCYVDPANGAGTNLDVVAKCPASQQRILRFVGNNPTAGVAVPLGGAFVFTACQGSAIGPAVTVVDAGP